MSYLNLHTVNPYIRVAMRSVLQQGFQLRRRIIFDYELIYIERGHFTFVYGDRRYPCTAGQFLLIHPSVPHSFEEIEEELSQPHIHFDLIYSQSSQRTPVSFKDLPELSREERALIREDLLAQSEQTPLVSFTDHNAAVSLLFSVIDRRIAGNLLSAKATMTELIERLLRDNFPEHLSDSAPSAYDVSRQIKDFIDASPATPIDLRSIEQQFSYSRFYLERQFKNAYGTGLIAYRNEQRLTLACAMLAEPVSVSSIAEQLGYSSIYTFSRAFKNRYGISPSGYQKNKRK